MVAVAAGIAVAVWIGLQGAALQAPAAAPTASFRVRLGVNDKAPRSWNGSVESAGGEVVGVRFWRPRPGYVLTGKTTWTASSTYGPLFQRRAWEEDLIQPTSAPVLAPGLIVDVRGAGAVNVTTPQGSFREIGRAHV